MDCRPPNWTATEDEIWAKTAKPGFRNPKKLWDEYWQRFNTCRIPLMQRGAFFADALACAQVAQDRAHLEELLQEKYEQRCRELQDAITRLLCPGPCEEAHRADPKVVRLAAGDIGLSGSLDAFVRFVYGVIKSPEQGGFEREMEDLLRIPEPKTPSTYSDRNSVDISDLPTPQDGAQSLDHFDLVYDNDLEDQIDAYTRSKRVTELRDDTQITNAPLPSDQQASSLSPIEQERLDGGLGDIAPAQDMKTKLHFQNPTPPADSQAIEEKRASDRSLTPEVTFGHQPSATASASGASKSSVPTAPAAVKAGSPCESPQANTLDGLEHSNVADQKGALNGNTLSESPCSGRKRTQSIEDSPVRSDKGQDMRALKRRRLSRSDVT